MFDFRTSAVVIRLFTENKTLSNKIGQLRYLSEKFGNKNRTTKVQPLYFRAEIFSLVCVRFRVGQRVSPTTEQGETHRLRFERLRMNNDWPQSGPTQQNRLSTVFSAQPQKATTEKSATTNFSTSTVENSTLENKTSRQSSIGRF